MGCNDIELIQSAETVFVHFVVRHKEREIVIVAASAMSPADSATVTGLFHHQHRVCFGFFFCVSEPRSSYLNYEQN